MVRFFRLLSVFLVACWSAPATAQNAVRKELVRHDQIEVLSPKGTDVGQPGQAAFKYVGTVKLRDQGVLLFCDQAIHQLTTNRLDAVGHVLIVQGDTIIIKADTLIYLGNSRQAMLRGRVTFQDRRIILNTAQLNYNLTTGMAHYTNRGRMVDGRTVLTSREGYYNIRSRQIELQRTVRLISPENTLTTEALLYNATSRLATLVEPTRITGKDGVDVAQQGQYDTQSGLLQSNAHAETLQYSNQPDSLSRITYFDASLLKSSTAGLAKAAKPSVSSSDKRVAPGKKPAVALVVTEKPVEEPMVKPVQLSGRQADTTALTLPKPVSERVKTGLAAKPKTSVKNPAILKREPVKQDDTVDVATTMVPTGKPEEQVVLATTDASKISTNQPVGPVVITAVKQPKETEPVASARSKEVSPEKPVIEQMATIHEAVAEKAATAVKAASQSVNEKLPSAVSQPTSQVNVAPVADAAVSAKKPEPPGKPLRVDTPDEVLSAPAANPTSVSVQTATVRAVILKPSKREMMLIRQAKGIADPRESDLERELNHKKRSH